MSRTRTIALLAGALLLLWLKPWRRFAARASEPSRPPWFDQPTREVSETSFRASAGAAIDTAGFSSGSTGTPPAPPAQPTPPTVEAMLDALATPNSEQPAEGPLSFEVLDDMQGQHSAEAHQPETPTTDAEPHDAAPATAASAANDTAPPPATVGSATENDEPAPALAAAQRDDLIVIEGIGPKVNLIMEGAGITSFAKLADTPVDALRQILRNNGIQTLDPQTWPDQARLAAEGRMDAMRELQGRIKNGRLEG